MIMNLIPLWLSQQVTLSHYGLNHDERGYPVMTAEVQQSWFRDWWIKYA
jgi:hypothetical protein